MLILNSNKDIWITKGDDGFISLKIQQQDFPYETYTPQDGDQVVLTVRKSEIKSDDNPILFQSFLNDGNFFIKKEYTQGLEPGDYVYDIQITFSNGIVNTIIGAKTFRILNEVTY